MSDQVSICDSIEPLLGDYADGEVVSAVEKAEIETHLKNCARCASEVAFLRATNFVISSSFPDVQPPADLFVQTALATYRRPTLRARIVGWLAPTPVRVGLGSALAAAVVVAIVVPITQSKRTVNESPALAANDSRVPAPAPLEKSGFAPSAPAHSSSSAVASAKKQHVAEGRLAALPAMKPAPPTIDLNAIRTERKALRGAPLERPAIRVADLVAPPSPRSMPAIINRLKAGRLVIPGGRESELSMRGHLVRTLPNGDLPKEFPAQKFGTVPIEEAPAPARIAALTSPTVIETGTEPSSAHTVVELPPTPKGPHITLAGAGGRVAFAPIQGIQSHDSADGNWLPGHVNVPTN